MRALVLLAAVWRAGGWVSTSQELLGVSLGLIQSQINGTLDRPRQAIDLLGYLWSLPEDAASSHGLGGGIAWAWDPALCDALLPNFHEDVFAIPLVTCHSLRAAMHRGFASWSENHARFGFVDVTDECARIGELNADCPLAEVWVTSIVPNGGDGGGGGASVTVSSLSALGASSEGVVQKVGSTQTAVATARPGARETTAFRYTNGRAAAPTAAGVPQPVVETYKAVISFNTAGTCW